MTAHVPHIGVGGEVGKPEAHGQVAAPWRRLWDRQLDHYPATAHRYMYLGITVLSAIVLYYEFYVPAAVAPSILVHFGMTWPFFVFTLVVANAVGAFASLVAGLADRWGRANLVTYGLLVTGLIALVGLPQASNLWVYATLYTILGFVEGMILVATPALIRDFSPQLGRASAMAFWTMGPVIASLTVALVASHTLDHLHAWQDQFIICGIVGMVVFAIALVGLRELSPGMRDQLMVSTRERVLVESRAAGVDVEESMRHPWRQMVKPNIVIPSLGIGMFLIIYYTLIAFLVVFMASIFAYSQQRANGLGNWIWAWNAAALLVVGIVSDKLRVRKPFMVAGAAIAMVATAVFAISTTHASTSYYTFVTILSVLAVGMGFVFSTWLAAFTETVENRNPALAATGLAIWGWLLRICVAGSFLVLPFVVTTMTPIVEHGTPVATANAKYSTVVAFAQAHPTVVADATKYSTELSFAQAHPDVVSGVQKYSSELTFAATHPVVVATATRLAPELAALQAHAALFAELQANPTSPALQAQAAAAVGPAMLGNIVSNQAAIQSVVPYATQLNALSAVPPTVVASATRYAPQLKALAAVPPTVIAAVTPYSHQLAALSAASSDPNFQALVKYGPSVATAVKTAPTEWQRWWWICFVCEALFLPTIFLLKGRWNPKAARAEVAAHERMVDEELAKFSHLVH